VPAISWNASSEWSRWIDWSGPNAPSVNGLSANERNALNPWIAVNRARRAPRGPSAASDQIVARASTVIVRRAVSAPIAGLGPIAARTALQVTNADSVAMGAADEAASAVVVVVVVVAVAAEHRLRTSVAANPSSIGL